MEDAHARDIPDVLAHFQVDPNRGLSEDEAIEARIIHGTNEMPAEAGTPFWKLVLKQFDDLLVKILIAAAIISFCLGIADGEGAAAFVEPGVIILILVANATVGVMTETNAEKAIEELRAYQADLATVLRGGRLRVLPAAELVPGDVVEVVVGNKVPADIRLVGMLSTALRVDQAILTGESGSVVKELGRTAMPNAVVQDKTCIVYSGTVVTVGRARGVVVGTGLNTAIGRIRDAMNEADDDEMTPLKRKLDEFGTFLSKVIAVICILVWVVNIGHFRDPAHGGLIRGAIYYFKIAVALAVAAIPEGLPAVVTTCLALGTRKMAKQNAIVRSLPSVETLGCTSVICSDKTGTLTTNMMSATRVCVVDTTRGGGGGGGGGGLSAAECLTEYGVTGNTYAPDGVITEATTGNVVEHPAELAAVLHLAICSSLCNDSSLTYNGDTHVYEKIGESTEVALRVLAEKIGLPGFDAMPSALDQVNRQERAAYCATYWEGQFKRIAVLDFTRDRKLMSVLATRKGQSILFTKGAPEAVLKRCTQALTNGVGVAEPMNDAVRAALNDRLLSFARGSLRVLALAMRPTPATQSAVSPDDERDLTFLGFVGMMDPPRSEVSRAVATCRAAGIRVVMVTGDNKGTAEAVASQIGLGEDDFATHIGSHPASRLARRAHETLDANGVPRSVAAFPAGKSFQGIEFDEMDEMRQLEAVANMTVFSRVEPQHKSRLVELLKAQGHVVAMTGDGVNDAPALRRADIGIAMGSGTAVAKHASDMVLADDNFASIVAAVAEGRAIYNNTKQFIRYMVSSNIGEVVCIFIAAALGMPETLCPVQLLWVNLVTDGLPATALGFNKPDRDIMRQRPRRPDESIVDRWLFVRYLIVGMYVGLVTVGAFAWWYMSFGDGPQLTWTQLTSFEECVEGAHEYSCAIFGKKERRPSTMSMSVLVVVEMFNALNALSENGSLVTHPPWSNPWLIGAIAISMALHCVILYVPWLAATFSVAPLTFKEWSAVVWFSFPVIIVDEILKFISRRFKGRLRYMMTRGDLLPRSMMHQS